MTGCLQPSRAIAVVPPGTWAQGSGDPQHAPYITESVPSSVQVAWDIGLGRGLPVAAIVQNDLIISVVSGGGIATSSAESGRRYWARRFDGSVAGHALRAGNRVYFVTQHRNGSAYALDLSRGRRVWNRRLGSSASTEPVLADGRLYVTTQRGELVALDTVNGNVLWRARTGSAAPVPPLIVDDALIVAARDTLVIVDRASGTVRARHRIAGVPSAPIAMRADTLFVAMHPGIVSAYAEHGARELWRHTLEAPVLAAPVATADGVFVLTRQAQLLRLDAHDAHSIAALYGAATESLTVTADGALVGTLDGRLVYVRRDGTIVWEEQLNGSVRAPAAVRGSDVFVSTLRGRLVKLTSG